MKDSRKHRHEMSAASFQQPAGNGLASWDRMIEQPPKPDVPQPPDVIRTPQPVNKPVVPGEPEGEERPDGHPVPPPTDPGPATM